MKNNLISHLVNISPCLRDILNIESCKYYVMTSPSTRPIFFKLRNITGGEKWKDCAETFKMCTNKNTILHCTVTINAECIPHLRNLV